MSVKAESQKSMSTPLSDGHPFETDLPGTELEEMMSVLRETAQSATSAAATAIILQNGTPDETLGGSGDPILSLTSEGPIDRELVRFCLLTRRAETTPAALQTMIGRPCRLRQATLHGSDYMLIALPFNGHRPASSGIIAFALHATEAGMHQLAATCANMARCAEILWTTHEGMSGLAYEIITLTNRASRLQRIAEIDPLTQLENSASFEDKVRAKLSDDIGHAAFFVLDIDHFKQINDLYGHQFGDVYLKTIARSLRATVPEGSLVGRLGGDEFGVLTRIPKSGRSYLEGLLSRCRSGIQRATAMLGKPDLGKVSIGASQYPDHGTTYSTLYDHADAALYAAKESGRSVSAVFHPNQHQGYNNSELANRFQKAVSAGDIHPHFQPVVDLHNGRCAGFEILARWRNDRNHVLEPSQFSAIFRDHSLAEKMTRTIMYAAFSDYARAIAPTGRRPRLALNVTFFDLMNPEFAFEVQSAVAETGFDWSLLTIEVTEQTMLGERSGQIFRSLNELRARGAKIALDDFGTGYGGLRHISTWPIDILKIDKFFIDGLPGNRRDGAVLEAVTGLAQRLGLVIVAEGIETAAQIAALKTLGCQYAQGFAFDRPLTGEGLFSYRDRYDLP